jgi:glutaminase
MFPGWHRYLTFFFNFPFSSCVTDNILLISRAFKNQFIIPEWQSFTEHIQEMYEECKSNTSGTVSQL